ncbi:MAG: anti-sigma factor [Armatimonadota bacterium]|nr:anti-sigma factor [Armatimonadota bacterium]MDR7403767.1 anti-sigma factor [Armatimonadota bacterium]
MTHSRLVRQLSAYLDRELPPDDEQEVREHLAGCDACQEELRRLQAVRAILRRLPEPRAPADLAAVWGRRGRAGRRWPATARIALAAVAAAVIVLLALPAVRGRIDRLRAAGAGVDVVVREHALAAASDPFADRAYLGLLISDASAALAGAGRGEDERR